MITHEARAEVSNGSDGVIEMSAAGLMPSDSWERPDAVVSTAKQNAHDRFFLDTPDGEWLSPGQIAHEVHEVTSAFVGETPLGRQMFLVAPRERTRPINQKNIPLDAHFAFAHALEREYLRAVQIAEDQDLITHEEAIRQAGGDPGVVLAQLENGRERAKNKRRLDPQIPQEDDTPVQRLSLAVAQVNQVAIPVGMVAAGIGIATSRKDGHDRRYHQVRNVLVRTAAGLAIMDLVVSACTSVQSLPPQEVVVRTPMPEQFNPTVDQAKQAVASWMGVRIPLAEGEFGVFPTQAIFEVDPTDSTGQKLKTLSLLNPDGRTTDPDLRYAMGLALVPSEKTGESVELPFLVQLGKNGEALMLGMFLDRAQSTKDVGVFRLNIVKDGQIRPVTQELIVTKMEGGVTIQLRDISNPNNIVTYNLVSTPKDVSLPSQQSAVPTEIVGNNWIEKVVAFMSGARAAQAAVPATPELLATVTPFPSETPAPTATPAEATMLQEFTQLNISFPERLQVESNKDGFRTNVVLSQDLMKNTGITDLNIPQDQLDQIGKYILGVAMWGNRTANPKLSAFTQFTDLKIDGDKIVALSESVLKNDKNVILKLSDGQRTIEGPVSSLQMMFVTTSESDRILEKLKRDNVPYVEKTYIYAGITTRDFFVIQNNTLLAFPASNYSGIEMPSSGGAKYLIEFEAYQGPFFRNPTEKLVDFSTKLHMISSGLVDFSPARDNYGKAFGNVSGPIPGFFCSGTWDTNLAFNNNTYWRGENGHLSGCDSASAKLFSPKSP